MHIGVERKFSIIAGSDYMRNRPFGISIGFGFRDDAEPGEIVWRCYWQCSFRWPVKIWRGQSAWFIEYGFGFRRRIRQFTL